MALSAAPNVLSLSQYANDSTVVLPESFETNTNKMLENWYLQNYTALDNDVEQRPDAEFSDNDFIKRLAAIPTTIELPYNSIVRTYIDAYTKKNRRLVEEMLGLSLYYMPIFEQALEREGLPLELKYLPVIESAMNPDAVSRSGATGLWQLMLPTARGYGMEVNTLVDERRDPVASSAIAAKLLRQLYDIYHDWSLAIAAYNCGAGNINKAIRRCNAEKKDFWAIYPYLPKQTRGYVPGFIAATYVMTYYNDHNISPALARKPIITDSVHVSRRVYFPQIAEVIGVPVEELKVLNPQYREGCIPGDIRPYSLVLPANQIYAYIMSEDAICARNADQYARRLTVEPAEWAPENASAEVASETQDGEWVTSEKTIYHKVKRGETLTKIAKRYGVSLWSLKHANGNIKKCRKGQTLKVVTTERTFKPKSTTPPANGDDLLVKQPVDNNASQTESAAATPDMNAAAPADDVASAETLSETAPVRDTEEPLKSDAEASSKKDRSANADTKATKTSSKSTKKTGSSKKKGSGSRSKSVKVKNGDSLDRIAKRNGTTVSALKRLNNLKGNNPIIKPGQSLRVK